MIDYNVGDRVESVNSGYFVETGPLTSQLVKYGTIVSLEDEGFAYIHWEGCGKPYLDSARRFKAIKPYREPREFWINPETKGMNTKPFPGYIHVREVIE